MYKFIRPLLFQLSPENAHHFSLKAAHLLNNIGALSALGIPTSSSQALSKTLWGLRFKNLVGLAAGFDKNAEHIDLMAKLGFGFIEIGTVTPKAQFGNPQPRMFRIPQKQALINRMGFNNEGVKAAVKRLEKRTSDIVVGGNIGKNKTTPNQQAVNDYLICFEELFDYVDYFVVNVSSPNTPNLRELQDKEPLLNILSKLQNFNQGKKTPKPLLLKIAPDLENSQLMDVVEIAAEVQLNGIIAGNTTISRQAVNNLQHGNEIGGLSGAPLRQQSNEVLSFLKTNLPKEISIIGVGGIMSPKDALEKMLLGADLLQVYTGFVYGGPEFIFKINEYLSKHFQYD